MPYGMVSKMSEVVQLEVLKPELKLGSRSTVDNGSFSPSSLLLPWTTSSFQTSSHLELWKDRSSYRSSELRLLVIPASKATYLNPEWIVC